jgi:LysM repeat protein
VGDSYCIEENFGVPPTSTSTATTPTSTGNGITTPTPTQDGMVANCNKFYLVRSGDTCSSVASSNGITLDQFYAWNPAVGTTCASLFLNYEYCVGIIGSTSTITTTTITTTAGNGIATPTPTQDGMAANCNSFYQAKSGDTCSAIASSRGISLDQFYAWNPAVGSTCASLFLGYYYCIGVIGQTPTSTTKTTTSTTTGNGITTPTPTQPGMVTNCNKFHLGEYL